MDRTSRLTKPGVVLKLSALALSLFFAPSGPAQESPIPVVPMVNAKHVSLRDQANILKKEAAKLDESMKAFNLHAQAYKGSNLHRRHLLEDGHGGEKTVAELHDEFAKHVTQLQGVVDNYRHFYQGYATHYQQFEEQLDTYRLDEQRAESDSLRNAAEAKSSVSKLAAIERQLADVLKKMHALWEKSPELPESYVCPAFDDLQKEFVQTLSSFTVIVKTLPPDQMKEVAANELEHIRALRSEMEDADRLHVQQQALQSEYSDLQKKYAVVYTQHQELSKEADQVVEQTEGRKKSRKHNGKRSFSKPEGEI
jgi:ABC-type phosphate transport system auxiliary subunit